MIVIEFDELVVDDAVVLDQSEHLVIVTGGKGETGLAGDAGEALAEQTRALAAEALLADAIADETTVRVADVATLTARFDAPVPDVQLFGANGTWTKPTGNYTVTEITVIGAGSGGGGGRRGAAGGIRTGGGGGGSGGITWRTIPTAELTGTVAVTCPAGGIGGLAAAGDSTNGGTGGLTADTTFGAYCRVVAGTIGALGGTAGTSATGGSSSPGMLNGVSGIAALATGLVVDAASFFVATGPGGAGSGITAGDVDAGGGRGGGVGSAPRSGGTGGTAPGGNGSDGVSSTGQATMPGTGGGGGASNATGAAGHGGAGGYPGGGGGGGGASVNGFASGAGGAGGGAMVLVVTR